MGLDNKKLKGLRTFHSDQQSLRLSKQTIEVPKPEVKLVSKTVLPPVLSPRKPDPSVINVPQAVSVNELAQPLKPEVPKGFDTKMRTESGKSEANILPIEKITDSSTTPFLSSVNKTGMGPSLQSEMDLLQNRADKVPIDRLMVIDSDSEITEGSIITDQKRDRFRLFPALLEALKSWFVLEKETLKYKAEVKQQAVPTVRSLENRKEVIEKASKQSALAPKDDYKKLALKIPTSVTRTNEQKPEPLIIKKKLPNVRSGWSHFEGETPEKTIIEKKAVTTAQETSLPKIESKPFIPTPPPSPLPPTPPTSAKPEPITKAEVRPAPAPAKPEPVPAPSYKTEPVQIRITPDKKPAPSYKTATRRTRPKKRIWVVAFGFMIAIFAIGSGTAMTFWFLKNDSSTPFSTSLTTEKTIKVPVTYDNIKYISLPVKRAELYEVLLASNKNPSASLTLILPTSSEEGGPVPVPVPADKILNVLNWQLNNTFLRSINEMYFSFFQSEPVIILKVSSFDNAFGGILSSEEELSSELAPLFGEEVTGTFVIGSDVGNNVTAPHFVDQTAKNHDVRVLKDELDQERIVYGFVNRNTIIVTSNTDTFVYVADKIR